MKETGGQVKGARGRCASEREEKQHWWRDIFRSVGGQCGPPAMGEGQG